MDINCDIVCYITHKDIKAVPTTEMPLEIRNEGFKFESPAQGMGVLLLLSCTLELKQPTNVTVSED